MRIFNKLTIFIVLLIVSLGSYASSNEDADTYVRQTITQFMDKQAIPGVAVALYVDGKPATYYFGYADEEKKTPVNAHTIFEVGSLTKLMTSLLLAQEIDAAKMQANDSVTQYLPELPDTLKDISLKSLATHTSGLPFNNPKTLTSTADLNRYFSTWKPAYSVDEEWVYSNFGMGMLGLALENVTHKPLNQLYLKQIYSLLKMQAIALNVPKKQQKNYAKGYDKTGKAVFASRLSLMPAADGIKLPAEDGQRFLRAAIGLPGTPDRIFYPMRMTQAAYVKLSDEEFQGLGWLIHPLTPDNVDNLLSGMASDSLASKAVEEVIEKPTFNGNTLIDKTGATDGFRAYIAVIPNKKSGIIILANKLVSKESIVNTGREILFNLTKLTSNDEKPVSTNE